MTPFGVDCLLLNNIVDWGVWFSSGYATKNCLGRTLKKYMRNIRTVCLNDTYETKKK